jgi:hypothetical protein
MGGFIVCEKYVVKAGNSLSGETLLKGMEE